MAKPSITGTTHTLPFDKLSPRDFERLCLWLVEREGFERAEHLGAAGSEQGRDIIAWRGDELWAFQCKRVQRFSPSDALAEVDKVLSLSPDQLPAELILIVTCDVSANTRQQVRKRCANQFGCHFWTGTELDQKAKRYPDIVKEFFQIDVSLVSTYLPPTPPEPGILTEPGDLPYGSRLPFGRNQLFVGRKQTLIDLAFALLHKRPDFSAVQVIQGIGGVGKTQLAVEFAYRYGRFYYGVHWLNASQPDNLNQELADCGTMMCLPHWPEKQSDQAARTLQAWHQDGLRLVILDNLEDMERAREWLAQLRAYYHLVKSFSFESQMGV